MNATSQIVKAEVRPPEGLSSDHIVDFDFHNPNLNGETVYTVIDRLHKGPDIQWTARNGGHWIVTRAEDIKWVEENHEIFSHEQFLLPRGAVNLFSPPITVDPPKHARYRAVLNPYLTPTKVKALGDKARALAIELIDKLKPRGRCEFVGEFGHVFPVVMFLGLVDLPAERREEFIEWGAGFGQTADKAKSDMYLGKIHAYLAEVIEERYKNPGEDMLSGIAKWRDNPRFESEEEVMGLALQMFTGGLDTVANMIGFATMHLATHPEHRRRLREDPEIIPRAAEEYLRRFGLTNTAREIRQHVERKGVKMKPGDMILVPTALSSLDDRKYRDPFTVDFDREELFDKGQPNHNTFGNGPHRCIGAPLARREIIAFLEEWIKRIPDFALDPKHTPKMHMSFVMGLDELHLVWDV